MRESLKLWGQAFLFRKIKYLTPGFALSHMSAEDLRLVLSWALKGGITSVRDMGGDVRKLAALRRDALLHEIESPYIYPGRHGLYLFGKYSQR